MRIARSLVVVSALGIAYVIGISAGPSGLPIAIASEVYAADIDTRAPVTVKVSPREGAILWAHLRATLQVKGDEEQDAKQRVDKAIGLDAISVRVKDAERAGKKLTDADFDAKRGVKKIARDDLERLHGWLAKACAPDAKFCPSWMGDDALTVLGPMRREFAEVLAGRNPY